MPAPSHPGLRAAVCDRQAIVARDLESTLRTLGLRSVGRALSLADAAALLARETPDLVLLDAHLGPVDAVAALVDALKSDRDGCGPTAVVRLTTGTCEGPCDLAKPVTSNGLYAAVEAALVVRALAHPPAVPPLPPGALDRVLGFLRREHARPVGLAELAELVGMAPFPFARAYYAAAGAAPYDTLTACRIEAAERLLRTTDCPPHQIAREVGFASRWAFEAAFADVTGLRPANYRAAREPAAQRS